MNETTLIKVLIKTTIHHMVVQMRNKIRTKPQNKKRKKYNLRKTLTHIKMKMSQTLEQN